MTKTVAYSSQRYLQDFTNLASNKLSRKRRRLFFYPLYALNQTGETEYISLTGGKAQWKPATRTVDREAGRDSFGNNSLSMMCNPLFLWRLEGAFKK